MKTRVLFLVGWLLTGMVGCNKETTTSWQSSDIKFYPEALEYLQQPVNTDLTFRDAITGSTEKVTVQSCNVSRVFQQGYSQYITENPRQDISFPDHYYQQFIMTMTKQTESGNARWMDFTTVDPGTAYNSDYCNVMVRATMFDKGQPVWTGNAFCMPGRDESSLIKNYRVNGVDYANVVRTGDEYSGFYWVTGIGLIKADIHSNGLNMSWERVPAEPNR